MASKPCLLRLQKEYQRLNKEPVPNISAEPRPNNILEWHFVINGPASTPYAGGQYHGKLVFPSEYPYKPPAIMMLTPKCGPAPVCLCPCGVPVSRAACEHCAVCLAFAVDASTRTRACASP